jgi:transcriptional/translational regulatory protein YebC/TACO1
MFEPKGIATIQKDVVDEDTLMTVALDAGAEDIRTEGDTYEVISQPAYLPALRQALTDAGIKFTSAEVTMLPRSTVRIEAKEANQVLRLMDQLEDHDDVQQVYANFDIPEEVLEAAAV